ncbi:MAG: hypothetical protein AB7O95_26835 [Geminicoccaceae bacterium]
MAKALRAYAQNLTARLPNQPSANLSPSPREKDTNRRGDLDAGKAEPPMLTAYATRYAFEKHRTASFASLIC